MASGDLFEVCYTICELIGDLSEIIYTNVSLMEIFLNRLYKCELIGDIFK